MNDDDKPDAADEPAAPQLGEVRTWTDRLGYKRQGRVQSVAVAARACEILTAGGGIALVPWDMLDPLPDADEPEEVTAEAAAERLAAEKRLAETVSRLVQSAVTGVYDELLLLEPDIASADGLKIRAGNLVRDEAAKAAEFLATRYAIAAPVKDADTDG